MSQDSQTGEKTEKPTRKKLRDARKEGNVAKSRDLSQTSTTIAWAVLLVTLGGFFVTHIGSLQLLALKSITGLSKQSMFDVGAAAISALLWLTLLPLCLVSIVGVLVEFLQAGPILAAKKITPNFSAINPAEGIKRVLSMDNLVEAIKSIIKTLILLTITVGLLLHYLDDLLKLPQSNAMSFIAIDKHLLFLLVVWVAVLFLALSAGDWLYQRFSHEKKLRMSKYDVKKENRTEEGDPQIKARRMQLHRRWANQNAQQSARNASVIVINPTHIAVALYYQPEETVVPVITVKGEGAEARLIRESAEKAGVPVMRNVTLARALNYRGDEDDFIPGDLFEAVAEVLAWAEHVRHQADAGGSVGFFKDADESDWLH